MFDGILPIIFIVVYFLLMRYVLPKFGVAT
ncbi:hypothetical protein U14_01877 [Candidatus Moduliflexus flocculans]|uniref:Uncharacterized protein n=1 Tax=Candidatus Moduliflexus flocculans TaxID=1499966 RepID=A0A0S6VWN0_9BACT|nr:hypothetical protein U14_01877 [Candidatus Moduliflexus flocculans]